ncbi:MAG: hypothetical protein GC200_10130 [Tepidisphaera sp.]|nr:hypothetical protein [Tepidisphaera sp.]
MGVFVGEVVVDDADQELDGAGQEVVGHERGAMGDGGVDGVQASRDVGAGHPQGQGLDGGFVLARDVAEGEVGVAQGLKDLGGDGGAGREGGEGVGGGVAHGEKFDARRGGMEGEKRASRERRAQKW